MWSYGQNQMVSSLDDLLDSPEKRKERRSWMYWNKFFYYISRCCVKTDKYNSI